MKDQHLFELCKEVYEKTGLNPYQGYNNWYRENKTSKTRTVTSEAIAPRYTSDYLLEKLPSWYFDTDIEETMILALMPHMLETGKWIGRYETPEHRGSEFETIADTPLKSLLKLTLALNREGLL